jgi:hypothetical protein
MHLSLAFILLLASSITLALSAPQSRSNMLVAKPTECQQSVTFFHKFFVIATNDETEFHFALRTPYTVYYPDALDKALRLEGFQTKVLADFDSCGWQKTRSVKSKSWSLPGPRRGDVYWKYRDLHWVKSKDPKVASHWNATSPDHIPPRKGAMPKEETLDIIERVLKDNEPAADVYCLSTICLSYLSAFLGMMVIAHLLGRYFSRWAAKTAPEYTEGIELAVIKANSFSKQSLASASIDTLATVQRSDESARVSEPSGQSTPLPVYSPNGTPQNGQINHAREPQDCRESTPPPGYSPARIAQNICDGNAVSRLKEAYGINVNLGRDHH